MQIELPTQPATLLRRYKRFLADVELESGEQLTAHCPNPGSMLGCAPEGARVILRDSQNPARKLRFTFQSVEIDGHWVNVDTGLANDVVAEGVAAGAIDELSGYANLRREVRYGENSRIDLLLEAPAKPDCYVEVKSTTLVAGRRAFFPDAVTARGKKHLDELARMAAQGARAVIFFLVARDDVDAFSPAAEIDPAYAARLVEVAGAGVEALAYTSLVEPERIEVGRRIPIDLEFAGGPRR